ncbi:hypothetical protein [Zhongshania sp. BJYM1]|jgi:opacity protein-like surface antigen|uniref:hypothetical protein n=1 Tax=Zhongshania aquatica TaxID=2965069 RepID=UPI0022B4820A|nr:hypothetical protein [Marortus sp. BJYM1]
MSRKLVLVVFAILLISCANQSASQQSGRESGPVVVGGDHNAKGCIGSAGYSWCERTEKCERPWELSEQESFTLENEGFANFCAPDK